MACRRFIVSGRVQGVWFRASTREQAERLGLAGHALNLPDGSVEVLACGSEPAIETLAAWLRHGPELARVEHLHSETLPDQPTQGFRTG
jgi:acylphosphatase